MEISGTKSELILEKRTTVRELLAKLNLEMSYFAVLVDGKAVDLDHSIDAGEKVIILPKIAGGN
ncbi:MAG: MoaD/ThiS family protein [Candidatus Helarchaeota archaeon]